MAKIPIDTRLKIETIIEDAEVKSELRPYLGMSIIGEECARKLWYGYRWCTKEYITARQQRLFQRGHREEPIIISDLEKQGVKVHSTQAECVACNGSVKGHIDGLCDNLPDAPKTTHLLEFKTANDKNFKALQREGLEKHYPVYYAQMVCYMRSLKLKRGLFITVNKNDDARYYERILADNDVADDYFNRAIFITTTLVPPDKQGSPSWYKCKWCKFYNICHFKADILATCRTCSWSMNFDGGGWACLKKDILLSPWEYQIPGCSEHNPLESLADCNFYFEE